MSLSPEQRFDLAGSSVEGAKRSNMFGVTCYKLGRRPFVLFVDEEIVCKLFDASKEEALALEGAHYFCPMGADKPMTNWVHICTRHAQHWEYFASDAARFVNEDR